MKQPAQVNTNHSITTIDLVHSFRQLRILVIGDAMLDTYLEGDATRLCSEGPVPVVRKITEQRLPGGAANTAANLRALGADVTFLSIIGHDMAGSLLRDTLRTYSVSDQWLIEDEQACTLHKLRILANGQYIVRFDEGSIQYAHSSPYTEQSQQQLLSYMDSLYQECDAIVVSDYCYGVLSDALIARLHLLQKQDPRLLLVDSKALQRFADLPATIVTPNYREALQLSQQYSTFNPGKQQRARGVDKNQQPETQKSDNISHVSFLAQQLLQLMSVEHIAITLAEHGVFIMGRDGNTLHLPAHRVEHTNDIGAGDSFAAALILSLAAGGAIRDAAQIGIDAAGIAVSKQRTTVVQYQELLQRVSLREYSTQAQQEITAIESMRAILDGLHILGHTIVFTNGVFDILHAGHVQFLRQARSLGDVLVVAVNSDRSTRRLKGPHRPINTESDRLALVAALDMVDYALLFDEDTPTALIRMLRPDIHVKGGDYSAEKLPEAEAVREVGGQVVILPLVRSMSTSNVISRIVELESASQVDSSAGTTPDPDTARGFVLGERV